MPEETETQTSDEQTQQPQEHPSLYLPIVRVDKDEWIVEGQATSEAIDSYGTIFDYDSSKKAFQDWIQRGNIREQHDPRKAVGKALAVEFDDANRSIFVRSRISKGARDTWEKVLDGTLSGYSISVPGNAFKVKHVERNGKKVPMYYDHKLAELSLVDAPGSPGCDISVMRADGVISDVIATVTPEEAPTPEQAEPAVERRGAKHSKDTMSSFHKMISDLAGTCGCEDCQAMLASRDSSKAKQADAAETQDRVERTLAPAYARLQMIAADISRRNQETVTTLSAAFESKFDALVTRLEGLPTTSALDEVRSALAEVKDQVERIAASPAPGGPRLKAQDKHLVTDPPQQQRSLSDEEAIKRVQDLGLLNIGNMTPEQSYRATLAAIQPIRPK